MRRLALILLPFFAAPGLAAETTLEQALTYRRNDS
jgi:hypothetical protein